MGVTDLPGEGRRDSPLLDLNTAIVRLHAEFFGKGPPRARTERVHEDLVICVLRDALTPVENTLIERGQGDQVHALRRSFQVAMEPEYRDAAESCLDRKVLAFMSQVSLAPDIAVEIFFLKPVDRTS